MDRAYSALDIKAVSDASGRRVFTGIASTPSTDMAGDIMEPFGAVYSLPLPFLWQHDQKQPIGWIHKAASTDTGIHVEGEVAVVADAGVLKDRLDTAWQSMKAKLVRGLSIGFKGIDAVPLRGGGMHYKRWTWLELSAVCVPMNVEASITAIKSADTFAYREFRPLLELTEKQLATPITANVFLQVLLELGKSHAKLVRRVAALEGKRR